MPKKKTTRSLTNCFGKRRRPFGGNVDETLGLDEVNENVKVTENFADQRLVIVGELGRNDGIAEVNEACKIDVKVMKHRPGWIAE